MIEIKMENELGLKIFISGVPNVKEMPLENLGSFIVVLEMEISKYYEKEG